MKKLIVIIIIVVLGIVVVRNYSQDNTTVPMETSSVDEMVDVATNESMLEETDVTIDSGVYNVVTSDSIINWTGSMGDVKSYDGTFTIASGGIIVSDTDASGEIVIDMTTLQTNSSAVVNHLKTPDFFDVETYPTGILAVTGFDNTTMSGNLTVKDQTNPVTIPISLNETEGMYIVKGTYDFDRSLWDVRYGSPSFFNDLGDRAINDIVPLAFTLALAKN